MNVFLLFIFFYFFKKNIIGKEKRNDIRFGELRGKIGGYTA